MIAYKFSAAIHLTSGIALERTLDDAFCRLPAQGAPVYAKGLGSLPDWIPSFRVYLYYCIHDQFSCFVGGNFVIVN